MVYIFFWSKVIVLRNIIKTDFKYLSLRAKIKLISIMYLSVWVTSPFLAYGNMYRILAFFSMLIWLILELFEEKSVLTKPPLYILLLYIFLLYTTPIIILTDGPSVLMRNIQLYVFFFFILIYTSYERKSLEILKPVIYLNIILMTVWIITTYIGLLEDHHASRTLIRSSGVAIAYSHKGIGGFPFIYSLLIYIICILSLIRYRFKQKKYFSITTFFLLFSVLLAILVVLKAEYSTAVLLMFISIVYFLFYSQNMGKNIFVFLVLILFYIIIDEYILDILKFLKPYAEGTNYNLKIQDLITSINLGESTGTTEERINRYIRSIELFIENPLLGVWSIANIGKHSLILDTFAQFGFFIGLILVYILFKIFYNLLLIDKKNKNFSLTIIVLGIGLATLNNVAMAYGFMFYIFYPYINNRIKDE